VKRIDGCIGTNLLYHFLATLDYPHGELVLRRKTAKSLKQFAAASSGNSVAISFWIAGDHFMVGWGRVEAIPPVLLFVDTGLVGAGVKLAESVMAPEVSAAVNKAPGAKSRLGRHIAVKSTDKKLASHIPDARSYRRPRKSETGHAP
jgi:hypothetical protein